MNFSKKYIYFNWLTLIFIYLVVVAGSFVRITGSGMGCPDWPKCFGQWVPPTNEAELPDNYKKIYSEGRVKKVEKFSNYLSAIGFKRKAEELRKDPSLIKAEALLTAALKERLLVFRLGGLIGEDRNPIHRLSGKALPTNGQSIPYLVHAKDVCGVIQHFFSKYKWGGTFNLFTETMKTKRQYYIEQAVKRGIEKPIFGMKYDIKRKLINDKITKEFGFQFTKLS